ncbi:3923_t:CDS:2, partial [Racocetra fulgida]
SSSITKFVEVPRLDVTQATETEIIDKVHKLCVEQGIPLVLENYHLKKEFDAELFTKEWIQRNCGDQEIAARDVNNILDEQMKLSDYLDYVEKVSKNTEPVQQKLYAKDVTCPIVWKDYIEKMSALVQALGQDVDLENYYVPIDILEKADFTVYHTKQQSLSKWTDAISKNLRSSADNSSPSFNFVTRIENAPGRDLRTEYKLLITAYKYILEQEWVSNDYWNDGVHFPLVSDSVSNKSIPRRDTPDNKSHMSCDFCHCDLWNRHVHCYDCITEAGVNYDICLNCYANGRACSHLMQIRKGRKMKRLRDVYTHAKDTFERKFGKDDELVDLNDLTNDSEATLAYIRWKKADSGEDM